MGEFAINIFKFGVTNIGAPLLTNWATNKLVGTPNLKVSTLNPTAPAANVVRDSAPGTINTNGGNSDANISQNTLIIGAVALVAVIMLVKKK